jgi:mannose-6-phosphate isomerase
VEKPWGRQELPSLFANAACRGRQIGEIIYDPADSGSSELLVKFLFTSEKLSIQVHPGDQSARAAGYPRGKDESWIVLDAEPGATIGLGLTRPLSNKELRASVLDGTIEHLVDWRPVRAGDVFYSPAGTIHAIGPGLSLIEVQQNLDLTYRLYDYGRPRELHIEEAVAAASTKPAPEAEAPLAIGAGRTRLVGGPAFQVERLEGEQAGAFSPPRGELWLIALSHGGELDGQAIAPGEVRRVTESASLRLASGTTLVIAYPGSETVPIWTDGVTR